MAIQSRDRLEPGSFNIPAGKLPKTCTSTGVDPDKVAAELVDKFNAAVSRNDFKAATDLFLDGSYWRDHLCVSLDFRTIKGRENIASFLQDNPRLVKLELDKSSAYRAPHVGPIDAFGEVTGVEFIGKVTSKIGTGRSVVRLAEQDGGWKFFTVFTTLQEIDGCEELTDHRRPVGVQHGERQGRTNWQDRRNLEQEGKNGDPTVLIVGAGQAGLTAAARLKMLGINSLLIDQNDRVGDNWRKRYHQLVLHDPVWFDHMPYVPFPANWPIFTPKDKLAEFFECYVKMLELNVWTKTTVTGSSWSDQSKQWTVELQRRKGDGSTETVTVQPHHIIQATGHSGKKNIPEFKGASSFQGTRLCHSSDFPGADPNSRGKKAVVVGACNSGHDIAQDYYEKGYEVTIVQRSSTCVVSSAAVTDIGLKGLYEESGPPTEDADVWLWAIPPELFKTQQLKIADLQAAHDKATLEGLERAGFKVDRGPDDAGLFLKYFQRGGGYYIDVGASQLIADGKIKVKHGQEITEIRPHGIQFADGSELEADEIVLATGYQNMRTQARLLFGDELADRVGDVWGFDREGEFRTMWRRSGHPGFWFMGGNLALCRYYSRLLALQIKATELGLYSA
ncbi:putative flavo protein [Aspergillus steynii IBT 23096]|uniref:Putative flavo protein n=1 Tax=Aspergillus steynii IBT 23096 TaxID=1392250 RepID=A0A2I2GP95_9EURO|nr:putative flavo protein [Aspergillus steynii IBT 23096]PLB54696.1 putative flavo protein [Aspergillus steynii IBT 23096]